MQAYKTDSGLYVVQLNEGEEIAHSLRSLAIEKAEWPKNLNDAEILKGGGQIIQAYGVIKDPSLWVRTCDDSYASTDIKLSGKFNILSLSGGVNHDTNSEPPKRYIMLADIRDPSKLYGGELKNAEVAEYNTVTILVDSAKNLRKLSPT